MERSYFVQLIDENDYRMFFLFVFLVIGVCGVAPESVSGKVGESVTLSTYVTKEQHDVILWYFNDIRIALIAGEANKSCLYDGEGGRFRDRLEVDYEFGSLTITHITAEHTGVYAAEIIRSKSSGTRESLNRKPKCDSAKVIHKINDMGDTITIFNVYVSAVSDSWLSAEAVAGICACAAVVLLVILVCIIRNKDGKNEDVQKVKEKAVADSWLSEKAIAGICTCAAVVLLVIAVGYCIFRNYAVADSRLSAVAIAGICACAAVVPLVILVYYWTYRKYKDGKRGYVKR